MSMQFAIRGTCFGGLLFVSACSVFNDPSQPTSLANGNNRVILTQADRRAVFIFDDGASGKVCPEPSPDVRADIDSALKGLIEASATVPQSISAEAKAQLDATRAMVTQALITRSQGLQMLRDLLFQACLANLRGDIPATAYVSFVTQTLPRLTASLITTELVTRGSADGQAMSPEAVSMLLQYQLVGSASP